MSAKAVSPPVLGTIFAASSEALAGMRLYELSVCQ